MAELVVSITARNQAQAALSSLGSQLDGLNQKISGLRQSLSAGGAALQNFGSKMSLGVTAPLAGVGALAISAASDLSESLNKIGVVFGDNAATIEKWSKTAATSLGMSQQQALEASGTFGNLFMSMGLGQSAAVEMSTGLVQLAADLASFNNIDPTEALEKLRAGIVGETEPLRTLGVNLSAAAVEAKALELGLAATAQELTDSDKATARYALIMEQTKLAQGDFARTSDSLANSQRILKAQLADAAAALGQQLLPYALSAVQAISRLVGWFSALSPQMQQMTVVAAAAAAAIGPLSVALGTLLSVVGALLSPVGLLVAAGAGLAAAWTMNLGGIQDMAAGLMSSLQPALEMTVAGAQNYVAAVMNAGVNSAATAAAIATLPPALQPLATALDSALATLQQWSVEIGNFAEKLVSALEPTLARLQPAFDSMLAGFGELSPQISNLTASFGELGVAVQPLAAALGGTLIAAFMLLSNTVAQVMPVLPSVVGKAIDMTSAMISLLATNISNSVALIQALLAGDWSAAWASAGAIVSESTGFIGSAFQSMLDLAQRILSALASAVSDTFSDITSTLAAVRLPNPFAALIGFVESAQSRLEEFRSWLGGFSLPNIEMPSLPSLPSLPSFGFGGNAIGSLAFGGGVTRVGETGPELVMLPRGSRIVGARETEQLSAGGGVTVVIQNATIRTEQDIYALAHQIREINRRERWS